MEKATTKPADPHSAVNLIRRLLLEQARQHIRHYVFAAVMMIVGAGCMALSAYLIGDMINQAYINRNFAAILAISLITMALYTVKGDKIVREEFFYKM